MNKFRLITLMVTTLAFAGCKKDHTTPPVKATIQPSFANFMDSTSASKSFYISNCGLATLPTPVAGNGTVVLQAGNLMGVNQGYLETPLPSTINFGPTVTDVRGTYPKYRLALQGDGNLVLYLNSTNESLWSSRTGANSTNNRCYLVLQADGNLVLRALRNATGTVDEYWATHDVICPGQQSPVLILQSDGNIVEEYPCNPIGNNTYGFVGNTGTAGGQHSNHPGSF